MANIRESITTLHKAFNELNRRLFNSRLPQPAILIQNQGNRKGILGWCTTRENWSNTEGTEKKFEINITAEYLNRNASEIICTMIHEMVHLDNIINGIQDCSRGGTYHNKKFKAAAERCGLEVTQSKKLGWAHTKLNAEGIKLYESLRINKEAFKIARAAEQKAEGKKTNVRKYVCPECGQIIRATKQVNVLCGICSTEDDFIKMICEEEEAE
jgi:rubrerythrin